MLAIRLLVLLALLVAPLAADAQQTKVYRVGVMLQGSPPPPGSKPAGPLSVALRDLGYIVGQNLVVDVRWAQGKAERFPSLAIELVALKPDVIVAEGPVLPCTQRQ